MAIHPEKHYLQDKYYYNVTNLLTVSVSLSMLSSIHDECLRGRKEGDFGSVAEF